MNVTVYTKPNCPQCDATKRTLDRMGVAYDIADAVADVELLKAKGHLQAPVVVLGDWEESFSGFQPDRLAELVE